MRRNRTRRGSTIQTTLSVFAAILLFPSVHSQNTISPRWGQSSTLLSPNSRPRFLVTSGKSYVAGQTLVSTPSTRSLLSLDLSSPIVDLSNPPWIQHPESQTLGPLASYGNLVPLDQSTALYFGGDATGDSRFPIQTRNDSSFLLSLGSLSTSDDDDSSRIDTSWWSSSSTTTTGGGGWSNQPERRESSFVTSATNGTLTRTWIYGGVRADGSGVGFDELWELQTKSSEETTTTSNVEWALSTSSQNGGGGGGGSMYDGTAVLVDRQQGPQIYFLGGVDSNANELVSLETIQVFTPAENPQLIGQGTWSTLEITTSDSVAPAPRRGHSAVYLGNLRIWISGGRDLGGNTVYSDSWVLDLSTATWTKVKDQVEPSWGASTILLGETILTTFGYGINSPASTNLKVYAFGNDTWLDSYYPSYLSSTIVPANPKATTNTPNLTAPLAESTTSPSNPKHHDPNSSSSPSTSSSSSPSSSSDSSGNHGDGSVWSYPGTPLSPTSDAPGTTDSDPSSSSPTGKDAERGGGGGGPSKSAVVGAVVGSLLGALALAAIGVYGMRERKRKRSDRYPRGEDRWTGYAGRTRLTGDAEADDDECMGMVGKKFGGGGGGGGAFAGLFSRASPRFGELGGGGRGGMMVGVGMNKRRRFDMLRDEEEEGEQAMATNLDWTTFGDEERDQEEVEEAESRRAASEMSESSTRIGVGIWGGLGRSESVKSATSYLGTNLGGFLRSGDSSHEYGGLTGDAEQGQGGDASLTPIAEWEEDQGEEDEDGTVESGYYAAGGFGQGGQGTRSTDTHQTQTRSAESHQTRSTWTSHEEASIRTATRVIRPFSPSSSSSLYGSGFVTPVPFTVQPEGGGGNIARSTSTSSSLFLSPIRRDNSSSWWSRLKQHQHSEIPTATAFEAIRDPTPAPDLDAISSDQHRSINNIDPFSDPGLVVPSVVQRANSLSEHGLMRSKSTRGGVHDRSISSNVSEVTATSSILEERMRGMDVVQRIRTGEEGSEGSTSSNQVTPELAQNPFADPVPGSVIFAGSQVAFSPRSETTAPPPVPPISAPFPLLPVLLPPTPTRSQSPPHSPRKARLLGPRPQPSPALPPIISRSGSVKDLVAEIERRNSLPLSPSSPLVPSSPLTSPRKATATRSRTTRTTAPKAKAGTKVEHGLVKKPKLYVANP